MITILTYITMICGGILVLMLLLSLTSGLDLDFDIGDGGDGGGGILKPVLVFFAVGSYIVRGFLIAESNPFLALLAGVASGVIAVFILSLVLKWLLKNQENVNWKLEDALYSEGTVYLKIPKAGSGLIHVNVNGVNRELKAKTNGDSDIPTGSTIEVDKIDGKFAIVTLKNN